MANVDNPNGFSPSRHLSGGEIATRDYVVTTGQTVYQGDLLKLVAAGTVQAAAVGNKAVGVASGYATGGESIAVYDDPSIIFKAQTATSIAAADIGTSADIVAGAGNATTQRSGHEIGTVGTAAAQLKVLGLIETPNNTWGTNVEVEVIINEHQHSPGAGI